MKPSATPRPSSNTPRTDAIFKNGLAYPHYQMVEGEKLCKELETEASEWHTLYSDMEDQVELYRGQLHNANVALAEEQGRGRKLLEAARQYIACKESGGMGATATEESNDAWRALKLASQQRKQEGSAVEHDVARRVDWEGDPGVINGTRSWEVEYCKACGAEGDELAGPCK